MYKICLSILFYFFYFFSLAQQSYDENVYQNQIELKHDNDFFLLTDRYYSSGLYLTYRTILKKGVSKTASEQLELSLGQEIFTPSQTQSTNIDEFDRSYAGYIGIQTTWSAEFDKQLIKVGFSLGLVGPNSGAGGFQRWYHNTLVISDSPLWVNELENSIHSNIYVSYLKEWELAPNPFGVRLGLKPKAALGSRDMFFETEGNFQFGRRNTLAHSIAYDRLGSNQREIFFAFTFAFRRVIHNGLIEGNFFGDTSAVLRESKQTVLRYGFDFNHRFNANDYKLGLHFNTAETGQSKLHKYIALAYSLSF
jgi:hypothetical protein